MSLNTKERLASLDILRGFDMWLLLMIGPVIQAFLRVNDSPALDWIRVQTDHVKWEGFVLWDIIMPLFMFMSGVTIPFSMAKYKQQKPDKKFWLKLLKRFFLLFFIGWIVQGNLLNLDPKTFHPFANTLQAIAVGYVFSVLIFVFCKTRWQIVFTALPFLLYLLAFVFTGMNLDPQGNVAMLVDKAVLGCHRNGVSWDGGTWQFMDYYTYTWVLSSLNFIVTVMLGCFCGQIVRSEKSSKTALKLAVFGAILVVAGLLLGKWFPIIKRIWSSSMTLYSGGICVLMLAFTYFIVDVKGWTKGLGWLKYYGMNAITAYTIGEVINFTSVSNSVFRGAAKLCGNYGPVLIAVVNVFILFFILRHMYKRNVFLKV